jgi:hypothetical protein
LGGPVPEPRPSHRLHTVQYARSRTNLLRAREHDCVDVTPSAGLPAYRHDNPASSVQSLRSVQQRSHNRAACKNKCGGKLVYRTAHRCTGNRSHHSRYGTLEAPSLWHSLPIVSLIATPLTCGVTTCGAINKRTVAKTKPRTHIILSRFSMSRSRSQDAYSLWHSHGMKRGVVNWAVPKAHVSLQRTLER